MTTIYIFCNSCNMADWHCAMAMDEHGEVVHEHVCSSHEWIRYDCGVRLTEEYDAKYPDGWQTEFVENPRTHAGLQAAYQKNQQRRGVGAEEKAPAPDNNRCAVCGWPLAESPDKGCVRGNCSQRPRPARLYDPQRAGVEETAP